MDRQWHLSRISGKSRTFTPTERLDKPFLTWVRANGLAPTKADVVHTMDMRTDWMAYTRSGFDYCRIVLDIT